MQKHSISPYPPSVTIKNIAHGSQVFSSGKYLGDVEKRQNWGTDWMARPTDQSDKPKRFFATKTEAVKYLLT